MIVLDGDDNFDSGQPFVSSRYVSPAQTITSGGLITLTHGLTDREGNPVKPFHVSGYLKCLVAEQGYSVGDEVEISLISNTTSSVNRFNSLVIDQISITFRFSSDAGVFVVANKTTGAPAGLANTNWQLYIKAWA